MKLKMLEPIYYHDSYSEQIARAIEFELYVTIFAPLFAVMGVRLGEKLKEPVLVYNRISGVTRWNAVGSDLVKALHAGTIVYADGYFYGAFKASIGLELRRYGARFDKTRRAYKLTPLPTELKTIVIQANQRMATQAADLYKKLDEARNVPIEMDIGIAAHDVIKNLNQQFIKTITSADIEIPMETTPAVAQELVTGYTKNLELYIKDWQDEQIERLREQVGKNVAQGYRADRMVGMLESEYGTTRNKAKFLARQETSLLVSKYREAKYKESGIGSYIWSTSHDERVRQDHKDLDRQTFSWSNPPVVDKATGRKANPGEDFGCRCLAVPVMRIGA